jgi:hypothetical protein
MATDTLREQNRPRCELRHIRFLPGAPRVTVLNSAGGNEPRRGNGIQETTMRKLITLAAIAFALATGTSMMALTVHVDRAHIAQDSPLRAVHQKAALLY